MPQLAQRDDQMAIEALSRAPLFASLPRVEIDQLATTLQARHLPEQTIVLREGCADDHFYVLLDGQVEIIKALDTADERVLGTYEATCLLGEMSLFSRDGCHTASVRALTPVKLLQMTRDDLNALLHRQPRLAYDLVRLLSNRLQESESLTIIDLREKNRQLTVAYRELQAAQAQIVEKERLERELEIARQIQVSVLPPAMPQPPGFETGARIVPARAVGGDFYDVIPLGGQRLGIVVGDVCDKGVPAALFMMRTYSLLRAKAGRSNSPAQVLREVNKHLVSRNPSGMFVTLLYGILDVSTGRFVYARAGHPCPIVLDGSSQPVAIPVAAGQPLGMWDLPKLDEQAVVIARGGMVVLFSDGLSETLEDQAEERRLERLCSRLAGRPDATAQRVCDWLWQEVVACSSAQQRDDFVAVVFKRAAS